METLRTVLSGVWAVVMFPMYVFWYGIQLGFGFFLWSVLFVLLMLAVETAEEWDGEFKPAQKVEETLKNPELERFLEEQRKRLKLLHKKRALSQSF